MKAIEQFFPVVLFIMLYNAALTFKSVDKILKCSHSSGSMPYKVVLAFESVDQSSSLIVQMEAIEQYFPTMLFVMIYMVVLTCVS